MSLILSGGTITNLTKALWASAALHGFWFDAPAPALLNRVISPSSSVQVAIADGIYRRDTGEVSVTDFSWPYTVAPGRPGPVETITRTTSNAAVIIPTPGDVTSWTWVSNGSATITLTSSGGTRTYSVPVTTTTGVQSPVDTFLHLDPASLRQAIITTTDSRIAGKTPSIALPIFSTRDDATPAYVRNASCWAADLDLTAMSPYNSVSGVYWAGILISPRHVLCATHAPLTVGTVMRFVTANNAIVSRTLTATLPLPGYAPYYPDCTVGVLDSDVPSTISFARVLPDNYTTKLPVTIQGIPTLGTNQFKQALVLEWNSITAAPGFGNAMVGHRQPVDATRSTFFQWIIGGDSGSPACLVIDNRLVLLNVWTFGGTGVGTSVTYWKTAINTLMTSLGGGYQLTGIDLSAYPSY